MRKETDADQIDFNRKILHMSWHPFEDSIAIAATNNVSHKVASDKCSGLMMTTLALRLYGIVSKKMIHITAYCHAHLVAFTQSHAVATCLMCMIR